MVIVMKKSKNKKIKKIAIILVAVGLCVVAGLCISKKIIENEKSKDKSWAFNSCRQYVQLLCGYVQCMDYAEKSNMSVDESVAKEIKEFVYDMYDILDVQDGTYSTADINNLVQLAYIYSYYGLDCTKIKNCIDKCYMEDEKMYNSMYYDGEQSKTKSALYYNYMIDMILAGVDDNFFTKCSMKEILEKWFNENVENIIDTNQDSSDLYAILYDFYIHRYPMNNLKYEYMRNNSEKYIDNTYKNIESMEAKLADVGLIDDIAYLSDIFKYNTQYDFFTMSKEKFAQISSREAFVYDIDSDNCIVIVGAMLKIHYETTGSIYNEFLKENLSDMIGEHYEKYTKGGLDEAHKRLEGKK